MNTKQMQTLLQNAKDAAQNIEDYPDLEIPVLRAWSHHHEAMVYWFEGRHSVCGCTDSVRCPLADGMHYIDDEPHNM